MTNSDQVALEQALQQLDVPDDKAPEMAIQLNKRALQLAEQGERTYEQALLHLLNLMKTAHDERNK
jgi:exonuclease VII small subunit